MEVDQSALGAQVLGNDLQLAGASYHRRDNSVSVMFGTSTLKGLRLSHHVSDVTEIDVVTNAGGTDQVLRVAHAEGQFLVTMH